MIKVLIVDDEELERKAIHFIISKLEYDVVCEEASNGQEGFKAFLKFDPDIVFTDIKMPGWDGIEMARNIRNGNKNCKIVFITAFDELAFLKEAIDIKAEKYLLKPIAKLTLSNFFTELIQQVYSEREVNLQQEANKDKLIKMGKYLENEIIMSLISGDIEDNLLGDYFAFMDISFENAIAVVFNIKNEYNSIIQYNTLKKRTMDMITAFIEENKFKYLLGNVKNNIYALLFVNDEQKEYFIKNVTIFSHLKDTVKDNANTDLKICIGPWVNTISNLSFTLSKAASLIKSDTEKDICTYKETETLRLYRNQYDYEQGIITDILAFNKPSANDRAIDILESYERQGLSLHEIKNKVFELIIILKRSILQEDLLAVNFEEDSKKLITMEDIKKYLSSNIRELVDNIYDINQNRDKLLIDKIVKYMEAKYVNNLSLDIVSKEFGVSTFHLSRLFKKHTGKNFIEYLTNIRINNAKKMLQETNVVIKDISLKAGYNNCNHFINVFKKIEGITPSQYNKTVIMNKNQ